MRTLALDVHARFAEVALHEDAEVRRVGQVATKDLPAFAESLGPEDHVVIESTSISWAIVDLVAQHAGRLTISNPMQTKAIAQAKVKTDKVDAKVLAQLGAADFLDVSRARARAGRLRPSPPRRHRLHRPLPTARRRALRPLRLPIRHPDLGASFASCEKRTIQAEIDVCRSRVYPRRLSTSPVAALSPLSLPDASKTAPKASSSAALARCPCSARSNRCEVPGPLAQSGFRASVGLLLHLR